MHFHAKVHPNAQRNDLFLTNGFTNMLKIRSEGWRTEKAGGGRVELCLFEPGVHKVKDSDLKEKKQ